MINDDARADELITRLLGVLEDYTDVLPITIDARDDEGHPAVLLHDTWTIDDEPIPYSLVPSKTLQAWSVQATGWTADMARVMAQNAAEPAPAAPEGGP